MTTLPALKPDAYYDQLWEDIQTRFSIAPRTVRVTGSPAEPPQEYRRDIGLVMEPMTPRRGRQNMLLLPCPMSPDGKHNPKKNGKNLMCSKCKRSGKVAAA